ncbi:MAG: RHS repeat-associated core domain-containing protein, partial [Pyrinomonadaceae bacterium]
FVYSAAGLVASMRLGNGKFENTQFNSRLQPTQIGLGSSANTQNLLKLNYGYGTTDNNGNVMSQTITVPTVGSSQGFTAVQTYAYDPLNRLKSATENIDGSPTPSWKQTFTIDRYGNRRFDTANTTTLAPGCTEAVCNPQIDPATNKLVGYQFDNSGNTKADANGQTFIYDAENKQVQVNGSTGIVGQYSYDGDGKRIKKVVPSTGETTVFVYDAAGKLVAEYSTIVEPVETARVSYLTSDHLGSPRITTDQFGQTISRRDFMPFGEDTFTTQRTQAHGYTTDNVRQQFTGYERDNESNLDYAKARMYGYNHGRFTSPDPAKMLKERMADPQHWNLYVYARNNPLLLIDPNGEFPWTFHIRSFIFTSAVGPGGSFRGDGRGPSLETKPDRASSRVRLSYTHDYDRGQITNKSVVSDPTEFYGVAGIGGDKRTGIPGVSFGSVETYNRSQSVSFHYWGKDPITPGFATPNLDVHANIAITESITKHGNGSLFINGTFTGDKFPSTEAFIVDQSGKTKLFLGVKHEQGGVSDLYGDNKKSLFSVDMQVKFDRKGNFTGVIQDGKTYSVDEWNKRVRDSF